MSVATTLQRETGIGARPQAVRANRDDFEAIYAAYHRRIFGLAYRMMGNADDALDVTQDAFISAFQNLHKTDDDLHLSAWLHRIAANKCIDALRRRRRRAGVDWDTFVETAPAAPRDGLQPETYVMNRELSERVQRVLDEMNPNYKLALLLHEHQGLSIREVAAITGRTESAVKSQLSRAREQFRGLYDLDRALEAA
jgi:RNA polymerase sigma-70 factor (ECF subfamily)